MMEIATQQQQYFVANRAFADGGTNSVTRCRPRWTRTTTSTINARRRRRRPRFTISFTADGQAGKRRQPDAQQRRRQDPRGEVVTMRIQNRVHQRGVTLVEVLVTMVILAIGLLGLVGLQARLQVLQTEAYQRAQALMLLKDMAAGSRTTATTRPTTSRRADAPLGAGMTCPDADTRTPTAAPTSAEWCNALQGASETTGRQPGRRHGRRPRLRRGPRQRPVPGDRRLAGSGADLRAARRAWPAASGDTTGAGSVCVGRPLPPRRDHHRRASPT